MEVENRRRPSEIDRRAKKRFARPAAHSDDRPERKQPRAYEAASPAQIGRNEDLLKACGGPDSVGLTVLKSMTNAPRCLPAVGESSLRFTRAEKFVDHADQARQRKWFLQKCNISARLAI